MARHHQIWLYLEHVFFHTCSSSKWTEPCFLLKPIRLLTFVSTSSTEHSLTVILVCAFTHFLPTPYLSSIRVILFILLIFSGLTLLLDRHYPFPPSQVKTAKVRRQKLNVAHLWVALLALLRPWDCHHSIGCQDCTLIGPSCWYTSCDSVHGDFVRSGPLILTGWSSSRYGFLFHVCSHAFWWYHFVGCPSLVNKMTLSFSSLTFCTCLQSVGIRQYLSSCDAHD